VSNIDWFGVFSNGLWILGLAIALAAVSYADWRRKLSQPRLTLRQALSHPSFQMAWSLGLLLFCAGLALTSALGWQTAAWGVLALAFLLLGGSAWLQAHRGMS
jgi:hypothetical protein